MKTCTFCKQVLPLDQFNKNKAKTDGLQNKCRPCGQARFREYYNKNKEHHAGVTRRNYNTRLAVTREYIFEYFKEHPCVDCGNKDIRVLEFDHLPEFSKNMEVSKLITGGYSMARVLEEIDKCEVRCRNCHAIKTYERMGGSWRDKYVMGL